MYFSATRPLGAAVENQKMTDEKQTDDQAIFHGEIGLAARKNVKRLAVELGGTMPEAVRRVFEGDPQALELLAEVVDFGK